MTELGDRLREEREAKGLSLNELQAVTKIQKRYLVGIEEGNYSMMPGKFYIRAFIKQYAEAVGLDQEDILEQYKNDIPSIYNEDLPEQLSRVQSRKSYSPGTSKVLDLLPKVLIGIVIIGLIVLIWYLVVKNADNDTKDTVIEENNPVNIEESKNVVDDEKADDKSGESAGENEDSENEKEAEEPEKPAQELTVAESNGSQTVYEMKNADAFAVKLVSTGNSWVGVKNGAGKSIYDATLNKDKAASHTLDLMNETEVTIRVGNAPAMEIHVNGEKLEYAISPTEVTTQNITIRYIKSE